MWGEAKGEFEPDGEANVWEALSARALRPEDEALLRSFEAHDRRAAQAREPRSSFTAQLVAQLTRTLGWWSHSVSLRVRSTT